MSVAYVDTSALVTIAFNERGGGMLARQLRLFSILMSSNLLKAELRAVYSREGARFSEDVLESVAHHVVIPVLT